MQKIYPVYLYPLPGNPILDLKAHFFAPVKFAFGRYIPTLLFNVMVIWLMTLLLFVTLYYKTFQRLIGNGSNSKKKTEVKE